MNDGTIIDLETLLRINRIRSINNNATTTSISYYIKWINREIKIDRLLFFRNG